MSGDEAEAIRELTGEVGELRGGFQGLKDFIELQTNTCKTNYENLNESFEEVRQDITGRKAVAKAKGRFRKIIESRLTLACVVVMALAATFTAIDLWATNRAKRALETIYTSAAEKGIPIQQIRKLESLLSKTNLPAKQPEE